MVDREVYDRRLGRLEALLGDLRGLASGSREEFLRDRRQQAQMERWLHLAAECVLDLANHLISDRGWRTPATYRESFQILREQGVIPDKLAAQMEGWAGLRNVLVHLYLELDHARLWEIVTSDLGQIESFARCVAEAASE